VSCAKGFSVVVAALLTFVGLQLEEIRKSGWRKRISAATYTWVLTVCFGSLRRDSVPRTSLRRRL
jgi:hypothetical protein